MIISRDQVLASVSFRAWRDGRIRDDDPWPGDHRQRKERPIRDAAVRPAQPLGTAGLGRTQAWAPPFDGAAMLASQAMLGRDMAADARIGTMLPNGIARLAQQ